MSLPLKRISFLVALPLVFSGCGEREIHTYRLAKNPDATPKTQQPASETPASTAMPTNIPIPTRSGANSLAWSAPEGWTAKPASSVRRGSFAIAGSNGETGDLSITAFPGDVGGALENVNRWRGQIGLPPTTAAALPSESQRFSNNALDFTVVEMHGTTSAILAAFVAHDGQTWFFKLAAPNALITSERERFIAFLRTVKPAN